MTSDDTEGQPVYWVLRAKRSHSLSRPIGYYEADIGLMSLEITYLAVTSCKFSISETLHSRIITFLTAGTKDETERVVLWRLYGLDATIG